MRYMIWNNKGGVGKTFLTYLLASEYARTNPEKKVVVADMCPQANVSEMLLGGNGRGESNLEHLTTNGTTVAGYIKARYEKSSSSRLGNEIAYFVKVSEYNREMLANMLLLPGDVDLDICATIINYLAQAPQVGAWKRSRCFLNDLLSSVEQQYGEANTTVFIDCNPSFANYTEMATLAANRLIIPCTADSSSIRGVNNVLRVVYGVNVNQQTSGAATDADPFYTFSKNVSDHQLVLPKIHLIIQNKSRSLDASATIAFRAHIDRINSLINGIQQTSPDLFTENRNRIINVKDGNTLAAIANHTGLPLSAIQHGLYDVYGKKTQANQSQIDALLVQIDDCVATL